MDISKNGSAINFFLSFFLLFLLSQIRLVSQGSARRSVGDGAGAAVGALPERPGYRIPHLLRRHHRRLRLPLGVMYVLKKAAFFLCLRSLS
jgi:hypothetical protein